MGCLFSKHREPPDGIYLDVHELKEIAPEGDTHSTVQIKSRLKNPIPKPYTRNKPALYLAHVHNTMPEEITEQTSHVIMTPEMDTNANFHQQQTSSKEYSQSEEANNGAMQVGKSHANNNNISHDTNKNNLQLQGSLQTGIEAPTIGYSSSAEEKVSRKCSFGAQTRIMEFNPKKSINIYRIDQGSIRDAEEDEEYDDYYQCEDEAYIHMSEDVICNDHFRENSNENIDLAFHNRNFHDSSIESDTIESKDPRNTYPKSKPKIQHPQIAQPHSSVGVRRAISQRKGANEATFHNPQSSAHDESTTSTRIPNSASSTFRSKLKNGSNDRLTADMASTESIDNEMHHSYSTRRRISAISLSSSDREALNTLDGINHLHPQHVFGTQSSTPDRRGSTAFDNNVRRLSINLVSLFHNQN